MTVLKARRYAESLNRRNKTDEVDALVLAQYGRERRPATRPASAPAQHTLARELAALAEDIGRLKNRLEAAKAGLTQPEVSRSLERRIEALAEELQERQGEQLARLQSIPGVGMLTASPGRAGRR